eukprot:Clim_evm3s152 gene=Clim_evmTU3s152
MESMQIFVDTFASAVDATPVSKDANYKPVYGAICDIMDQFRANQASGMLDRRDTVLKLYDTLMLCYRYDSWHLKQLSTFTVMHLIAQAPTRLVDENLERWTKHLLELLCDYKREIRDAASQALGQLARAIGTDIFDVVTKDFEAHLGPGVQTTHFQPLEGHCVAMGYIIRYGTNIRPKDVAWAFDLLLPFANATHPTLPALGEQYAAFVRRQSTKALDRILRSTSVRTGVRENWETYKRSIEEVWMGRLRDGNIDVRRVASSLFEAVIRYRSGTESDDIVREIVPLIRKFVDQDAGWEARHGAALAMQPIVRNTSFISHPKEDADIYDMLHELINSRHGIPEDKDLGPAGSANAAAGQALIDLYLTHLILQKKNSTPGMEEKTSDAFQNIIKPDIMHLLSSETALLLDMGDQCVLKVASHFIHDAKATPDTLAAVTDLGIQLYKNRFHPSMPVRDAANKAWNACMALLGTQEAIFIENHSKTLLTVLMQQVTAKSFDVRDSAFQAVEAACGYQFGTDTYERSFSLSLVASIERGCYDTRGGPNSEYPRAAAYRSLASFLTHLASPRNIASSDVVKDVAAAAIVPITKAIDDDEHDYDSLFKGVLLVVAAIMKVFSGAKCTSLMNKLQVQAVFPVSRLAHVENLRRSSVVARISLVGDYEQTFLTNHAFFMEAVCDPAQYNNDPKFRIVPNEEDEPDEDERNLNVAVLKLVSRGVVRAQSIDNKLVNEILKMCFLSLRAPDNQDSPYVRSCALGMLASLLSSGTLQNMDDEGRALALACGWIILDWLCGEELAVSEEVSEAVAECSGDASGLGIKDFDGNYLEECLADDERAPFMAPSYHILCELALRLQGNFLKIVVQYLAGMSKAKPLDSLNLLFGSHAGLNTIAAVAAKTQTFTLQDFATGLRDMIRDPSPENAMYAMAALGSVSRGVQNQADAKDMLQGLKLFRIDPEEVPQDGSANVFIYIAIRLLRVCLPFSQDDLLDILVTCSNLTDCIRFDEVDTDEESNDIFWIEKVKNVGSVMHASKSHRLREIETDRLLLSIKTHFDGRDTAMSMQAVGEGFGLIKSEEPASSFTRSVPAYALLSRAVEFLPMEFSLLSFIFTLSQDKVQRLGLPGTSGKPSEILALATAVAKKTPSDEKRRVMLNSMNRTVARLGHKPFHRLEGGQALIAYIGGAFELCKACDLIFDGGVEWEFLLQSIADSLENEDIDVSADTERILQDMAVVYNELHNGATLLLPVPKFVEVGAKENATFDAKQSG